jgi:hypothetical protein
MATLIIERFCGINHKDRDIGTLYLLFGIYAGIAGTKFERCQKSLTNKLIAVTPLVYFDLKTLEPVVYVLITYLDVRFLAEPALLYLEFKQQGGRD